MGEKATIFQGVQIGVEATAGIAVPANKKILSFSMPISTKVESDKFRAMGNKYASFATLNKEWTEAEIEGKISYNEIAYLLASLLSKPAPAKQGTTPAYKWDFSSLTSAEDVGASLTVEQGDNNSAWRSAGMRGSGLTLTFNRKEVGLKGGAIGKPLETGITMTASPTAVAPIPILPGQVCLKMASSQAALATAPSLTRGFSLIWALADKFGLAWPLCADPIAVEQEPKLEYKLKLATDAIGMGLIADMRAGSTKWFRLTCTGPVIAEGQNHKMTIDFPAQIDNVGDFSDDNGIYLMEYSMVGVHDAAWGKAFSIELITELSAL